MPGFHQEREQLASGKYIIRSVDDHGILLEEQHGYDEPAVSIVLHYESGQVVSEYYLVNQKSATQKKYEQACQNLADMPAAGQASEGAEDRKAAQKAEHSDWLERFKAHTPNARAAQDEDAHVRELIAAEGTHALDDALNPNLVVYFDEPPGKKVSSLRERLGKLGIEKAWLIGLDEDFYEDANKAGCDGLAVELPQDADQRSAFFILADKAVKLDGFSAPMDNGQALTFITRI